MKQAILNDAGEPIGFEEVQTEQDRQDAEWEAHMDDNSPDGVTCPKCKAKLMSEDAYDYGLDHDHEGWMCWKCETKF